MKYLTKFLLILSGVDADIIDNRVLRGRYIKTGGTVIFTSAIALLSGFFFTERFTDDIFKRFGYAVIWAGFVMVLDAFFVAPEPVDEESKNKVRIKENKAVVKINNKAKIKIECVKWGKRFLRLIITGIIAYLITEPLVLRFYDADIKAKIPVAAEMLVTKSKNKLDSLENRYDSLSNYERTLMSDTDTAKKYMDKLRAEITRKEELENYQNEIQNNINTLENEDRIITNSVKAKRLELENAEDSLIQKIEDSIRDDVKSLNKVRKKRKKIDDTINKMENEVIKAKEEADSLRSNYEVIKKHELRDVENYIENIKPELKEQRKRVSKEKKELINGFTIRDAAFELLLEEHSDLGIWSTHIKRWLITILFIVFDTAAILFSAMRDDSTYRYRKSRMELEEIDRVEGNHTLEAQNTKPKLRKVFTSKQIILDKKKITGFAMYENDNQIIANFDRDKYATVFDKQVSWEINGDRILYEKEGNSAVKGEFKVIEMYDGYKKMKVRLKNSEGDEEDIEVSIR
jgi:hypothetical protein